MWLFDWFRQLLWGRSGRLVFLGLDNAGKTTLLNVLRDNRVQAFMPTQKPTMEELTLGAITFRAYDLGGHEIARRIWRDYYTEADAVVFLVDAADVARLPEAKLELQELLGDEALAAVPIAVLGNKIDLPEALSEHALRSGLGLELVGERPVELFMCSVVTRGGYKAAFQWITQFIR